MIRKHIDIVAVMLLLGGFALLAGTQQTAVRLARARLNNCKTVKPLEVRVGPMQMNHFDFHRLQKTLPPSLRLI